MLFSTDQAPRVRKRDGFGENRKYSLKEYLAYIELLNPKTGFK